jgi:hypothetical protein
MGQTSQGELKPPLFPFTLSFAEDATQFKVFATSEPLAMRQTITSELRQYDTRIWINFVLDSD